MINGLTSPNKWDEILARLDRLGVLEKDLTETFSRSGGKGGQNVNKVETSVTLIHRPSGIIVRCQEARSQAQNRFFARLRLIEKLESRLREEKAREKSEIEKIRRQKRGRSKAAKARILKDKRHRSGVKNFRARVRGED